MGLGVTGYLQATDEQRAWLCETYGKLRRYDVEFSARKGWPTSKKLTTCKPSGTLSLLPGVTPGVHPGYAQYFIRRIQVASNSPLVDVCRKHGYKIEPRRHFDGTSDHTTVVVEFPCSYPEGTVLAEDLSAVQQMEWVKKLQTEWSDNAVSCTVYYKKDELPEIREWLKQNYNKSVKTMSFLLHQDHGFEQAPYEKISKEQYEELVSKVTPIVQLDDAGEGDDSGECRSGMCPIK
jgi:hypothetical protein